MARSASQLLVLRVLALVLGACTSGHPDLYQVLSDNGGQTTASAQRETIAGKAFASAKCKASVNLDDLKLGLRLGSQFLVRSQRPAGNFRYEYDWVKQTETQEDNPVRQAGTLWGLSLLHLDDPESELMPILRKGLQYFGKHSVEFPGGLRLMLYPGQVPQKLGAVALLALTHIEVLRKPEALESEEKKQLEVHLDGYIKAILAARTGNKNFHRAYHGETGKAFGNTSPYFDGECLLALVKAAKYLGYDHLWPDIKVSAEAGWRKNVFKGLQITEGRLSNSQLSRIDKQAEADAKKRLAGYYQWSSMAWFEAMGTKDAEFKKYAQRTMRYSEWMLSKYPGPNVNTGYAFEGLVPAFVTAAQEGNQQYTEKFACAIREGIDNLHTLQVGHTKATGLAVQMLKPGDAEKGKDGRAQGGAQGNRQTPSLRIDTTQHQLHALLMARRLLQQQALI